jgi:hypothetical protein
MQITHPRRSAGGRATAEQRAYRRRRLASLDMLLRYVLRMAHNLGAVAFAERVEDARNLLPGV